ncbi:MAG TPA: hypothetical protein PK002_04330 [Cellvibrio sp.]|nr:hypothetical protein [Cellvibrio sp.]
MKLSIMKLSTTKLSTTKLALTKQRLSSLAILTGALLLQGCGGGGLAGGDNKDIDTMRPVAGTEDLSARPRPPENAVVITTDEHLIYDALKQPIFLRGINHHFAASPATRIAGIPAIKLAGSNAIRLQLDENTTEIQFEGAMAKIAESGMVAVVTLTAPGNKLTCSEDSAYLLNAVDTLWLKKFMPILVQDRFQSHIMLNIANGWGAMDIFNQDSLGYQEYLDTYKALIRKFRTAGFKFPLVIDAPSCGQDFNAFLNGRSRELMAADSAKNLVFGVHAEGPKWNTSDEIINAATQLYNEKVPFIVTNLVGSGVAAEGDAPVDHKDVMEKSAGNVALAFNLPWSTTTDSAAYATALEAPLDLRGGAVVSTHVFLDKLYAEFERNNSGNYVQKGKLSFALYVKDDKGNTLKAGSVVASDLRSNQWSKLAFTLPKSTGDIDAANFMNGATAFDLTKVATLGIQMMANGKPAALKAPIKFDDLSILPGVPPLFVQGFDSSSEGWSADWMNPVVGQANGALTIVPTLDQITANLIVANNAAFGNVKFDRPLEVTYRVYLPAEYQGQSLWGNIYGKFGSGWSWVSNGFPAGNLKAGQWTEVKTTIDFTSVGSDKVFDPKAFGLQIGGYTLPKVAPILIDSISISDPSAKPTKTVIASQYKATFTKGTEGFVNAGWDGGKAVTSMAGGELLVTVPAGDGGAINKADINSVAEIDFKGGITVNMKVFIPADWAGSDFWIKFFMQDGNWNHFEYTPALDVSKFKPGEWASLEFKVNEFPANFSRTLKPQMFGMQYGNVPAGTIKLDDIEIFGATQVDDSKPIFTMGFETEAQFNAIKFDSAAGGFSESGLASAKFAEWKVIPFGWLASSWKGNTGDNAVLDISKAEDIVDLTARGEDIVNGVLGIKATSRPANFYQAPKVN